MATEDESVSSSGRTISEKVRTHPWTVIGSFATVVGLLITIGTVIWSSLSESEDGQRQEETTRASIDQPPNGQIPRCAVISGTAPDRDGSALWLAQSSSNGNLFVKRVSLLPQNRWSTEWTIGNSKGSGIQHDLTLFHLPQSDGDFLESIRVEGEKGEPAYWYARRLPAHHDILATATVRRDDAADAPPCS